MNKKHKEWAKSVTDFYYANELEFKTRQHKTVKKGSDQTPINYMIRASEHPIHFLSEKYNLQQLHIRGILNPLMAEAGWVWHFNGFDKEQRNNLMRQVWDLFKDNYEVK